MKTRFVASLCVLTALYVAGCSQPQAPEAGKEVAPVAAQNSASPEGSAEGKALMESKCAKCHKAERVQNFKEAESWKDLVDRMAKKNNAAISSEQAAQITAYLETAFPK